ncbi:MAG: hypothetical protein K1X75_01485 [Leptospirales bacterium]|nr:hypothetical protein [Leptospirales bacterium]
MELFGRYGPASLEGLALRDIKYARARLSVLSAFAQALRKTEFAQIRIKDICRQCEISDPSFYNYFPQKNDVLLYFIGLWSIDLRLHVRSAQPGLPAIYEIFDYTAQRVEKNPALLREIIAYQAHTSALRAARRFPPITVAERQLLFGAVEGAGSLPAQGLGPVLREQLLAAQRCRQIPALANVDSLQLAIAAIFFGVALQRLHERPPGLARHYRKALQTLLPSVGSSA